MRPRRRCGGHSERSEDGCRHDRSGLLGGQKWALRTGCTARRCRRVCRVAVGAEPSEVVGPNIVNGGRPARQWSVILESSIFTPDGLHAKHSSNRFLSTEDIEFEAWTTDKGSKQVEDGAWFEGRVRLRLSPRCPTRYLARSGRNTPSTMIVCDCPSQPWSLLMNAMYTLYTTERAANVVSFDSTSRPPFKAARRSLNGP